MSRLLPDRYTRASDSIAGQAIVLLNLLPQFCTVARAWITARETYPEQPFSRFVLLLDVLFALRLIELRDDEIVKVAPGASVT